VFDVTLPDNFQYQCHLVYTDNITLWDKRKNSQMTDKTEILLKVLLNTNNNYIYFILICLFHLCVCITCLQRMEIYLNEIAWQCMLLYENKPNSDLKVKNIIPIKYVDQW
jgi:hypothetical protein